MVDIEINISEMVTDEKIKNYLGMTREQFEKSEVKNLLEAMLYSYEKTVHEEALNLMKEHSLTYGEARSIVMKNLDESIKNSKQMGNND